MRIGRDGKLRPQMPKREDQSDDELVVSADSGEVEPQRMKIGMVVGMPKSTAELEAAYGGVQEIHDVEFIEVDDEAPAPSASSPTTSPGKS
jgi:hypothetical protein